MHALDGGDPRDAARLQPVEEFRGGARMARRVFGFVICAVKSKPRASRCRVIDDYVRALSSESISAASHPMTSTARRVIAMASVNASQT